MTPSEFLEMIKRLEQDLKTTRKIMESLKSQVIASLIEHTFNWYPEWKQQRKETEEKLKERAAMAALMVLDAFDRTYDDCEKRKPVKKISPITKPTTREKWAKDLQEILKDIPAGYHEELTKKHWEDFENTKHDEDFCFEAHRLVKKAITDHFTDELKKFEAAHLKMLDSLLYYTVAFPFVDECYEIMESGN